MKPKRVRITANLNGNSSFDKYVSSEHSVIEYNENIKSVILLIEDFGGEPTTEWFAEEYEVTEWIDDKSDEYKSIMQGLQEAIDGEGVVIGKDARNNERLYDWEKEPCKHCGKYKTYQGHDGCIGELDGLANACCGHGKISSAYVQFWDGTVISGEDAVTIQSILKRNKSDATLEYRLKFLKGNIPFFEENKFEQFKQNKEEIDG